MECRMSRLIILLAGATLIGACASQSAATREPPPANPTPTLPEPSVTSPPAISATPNPPIIIDERRQQTVELARSLLGHTRVKFGRRAYPNDCTGLVRAIYEQLGINLFQEAQRGDSGVQAIHRFVRLHGQIFMEGPPLPGDLVFFRETYDRNRDGKPNDGLTHIGLVESVADDGTVMVIHRVKRGVVRYHMNLQRPGIHTDPKSGRTLNDYLRFARRGQRSVLTGELFVEFGSLLKPALAARR